MKDNEFERRFRYIERELISENKFSIAKIELGKIIHDAKINNLSEILNQARILLRFCNIKERELETGIEVEFKNFKSYENAQKRDEEEETLNYQKQLLLREQLTKARDLIFQKEILEGKRLLISIINEVNSLSESVSSSIFSQASEMLDYCDDLMKNEKYLLNIKDLIKEEKYSIALTCLKDLIDEIETYIGDKKLINNEILNEASKLINKYRIYVHEDYISEDFLTGEEKNEINEIEKEIVFKNNQGKIYKKIVLCGDGGVGRTALAQFYTQQPHKFNADTRMTIGIQFFSKSFLLKNIELIFVFFDLAGQERWRCFQQDLIKKADGAIFTFDLTRELTLMNISKWVEFCRRENPKLPILMIGTKLDLINEIRFHEDYALSWKEEAGFYNYISVSVKTGENVHIACHSIFQKAMEKEVLSKEDDLQWKNALVKEDKKFNQLIERNKAQLKRSVRIPQVAKITVQKQKNFDISESQNLRKELLKIIKVAHRLKLEMVQNALQLNKLEFDKMIFKWAEEFGFEIDGDYLIIQKEEVPNLIEEMENIALNGSELESKSSLDIKREYDFVSGEIRFRIALKNLMKSTITNIKINFDVPTSLRWVLHEPRYPKKGDTIEIPKLGPQEKTSIAIYLTPISCLEGQINATITYFDSYNNPHAFIMEPKTVAITCPIFFTPQTANLARVKNLYQQFSFKQTKLYPIINKSNGYLLFEVFIKILNGFDIKIVSHDYNRESNIGEAWFYGETKVKKNRLIVHISTEESTDLIQIKVGGDTQEQVTSFLAEINSRIKEDVLKKDMFDKSIIYNDIKTSILSYLCPYCGDEVLENTIQNFIDGESFNCRYCNVSISTKELNILDR
ncbi:MAG: Rab family GTPase [Promethearchaeota archaeon]